MELKRDWPTWSDEDRLDFCVACRWLFNQPDFADRLRFVLSNGEADEWRCIAMLVAQYLPCEEAFRLLSGALSTLETGNFTSYCRTVEAKRTSNDKKKGANNSKCGNKYLELLAPFFLSLEVRLASTVR